MPPRAFKEQCAAWGSKAHFQVYSCEVCSLVKRILNYQGGQITSIIPLLILSGSGTELTLCTPMSAMSEKRTLNEIKTVRKCRPLGRFRLQFMCI